MFSAVIFDMDGLLLDSERNIMRAWLDASHECGFNLSQEQFMPLIGHGSRRANAMLIEYLGGEKQFLQVRDRARNKLQAMGRDAYPLKPGAIELLTALAERRIPCAVASSTSLAEVKRRLEMVGILHFLPALLAATPLPKANRVRMCTCWPRNNLDCRLMNALPLRTAPMVWPRLLQRVSQLC